MHLRILGGVINRQADAPGRPMTGHASRLMVGMGRRVMVQGRAKGVATALLRFEAGGRVGVGGNAAFVSWHSAP